MAATREARAGAQEFDIASSGHTVAVTRRGDGTTTAVGTQYLGHGRLFLVEGDERRLAWVAEDGERRWVFCDGEVVVVEFGDRAATRRRPATATSGHDVLCAPMPATVVQVVAPVGTRVPRGGTVLLLEAMKMELPLRAPHDAVVRAVHCREGELVQPDVTLVDLEAAPVEG